MYAARVETDYIDTEQKPTQSVTKIGRLEDWKIGRLEEEVEDISQWGIGSTAAIPNKAAAIHAETNDDRSKQYTEVRGDRKIYLHHECYQPNE